MSEKSPDDLSEWHNGKRTRISDIAKAQLVAQAMKPYEDSSAAIRFVTESAMTLPYRVGDGDNDIIDFVDLNTRFETGPLSEHPLTKVHNWDGALTELEEDEEVLGNNAVATAGDITGHIQRNNAEADYVARIVADAYDRIEATKR